LKKKIFKEIEKKLYGSIFSINTFNERKFAEENSSSLSNQVLFFHNSLKIKKGQTDSEEIFLLHRCWNYKKDIQDFSSRLLWSFLMSTYITLQHLLRWKKYIQVLNFPFQESKNPRSRDRKTSCGIE